MPEKYLSPAEVTELIPGMTINLLSQMRYRGDGPPYIEASPRKRVYAESSLRTWLASRERQQTGSTARSS